MLLEFYNKGEFFDWHLSTYYENKLNLQSVGLTYEQNNIFLNIGKLPIKKYVKNDFILSQNALPFNKIEFGSTNHINFRKIYFDFSFLIGELNDESQFIFNSDYDDYRIDKYLQPPLFHKKHFSLIFKNKQDNLFTVGFHHGAMFGGEILAGENIIKPRNTFESFLDVFILRTNTYQDYDINGEGNHLGFWNFQLKTKKIHFNFDKYFDDKSGFEFKNSLDGFWGLDIFLSEEKYVKTLGLSALLTTDQSGNIHPPGVDSYYWHHIYTKGWRHNDNSYGNPFIFPENNRKNIYNIYLELSNKNFSFYPSFYKINEFNYYGNKGNNNGIPVSSSKILNKFYFVNFKIIHENKGLSFEHNINYNNKIKSDFGYILKITKSFKL